MAALSITLPPTPKRGPTLLAYQQAIDVWTKQAQQSLKDIATAVNNTVGGTTQLADATHTGLLSSADWVTFNNKQPSGSYLVDAPIDGTIYGRKNATWVPAATAPVTGNLVESTSDVLTITGGTGAVVGSGTTIQVIQASASMDGFLSKTDWATFNAKASPLGFTPLNATKGGRAVVLCSAYTPLLAGADTAEVVMPFDTTGASLTFSVARLVFRVGSAGGAPSVTIEKSTGSGIFTPFTVGTVTLSSGAYQGSVTASLGTINSGDKLRFNVITLATALNWTVIVEISPP